ncbi:hypothetical protein MMC14_003687 [Varicellaria rhodocarpa]|nr:hypothetical protein [Varicellaria rhodocarpa]
MWYKRDEAQRRFTIFFSSTTLAAAFGGLLASGIAKMNGIRDYSGWRWIFILEGILTCVLAIAAYFLIVDFPEEARWLTDEERDFIQARLKQDQGDTLINQSINMTSALHFLKDFKAFLGAIMYFAIIIPAYGFAYFSPTIIKSYGYGPISTQLHSVPPVAAAFVSSLTVAYLSDKFRHRFLFVLIPICVAIAGVGILLTVHHNFHAEYAALFLVAMGTYSAMPVIICWYIMNLFGHVERSVGTAWMIGFGNIGGIIATFSFIAADAPYYHKGYSIVIGGLSLSAFTAVLYLVASWSHNQSLKRGNSEVQVEGKDTKDPEHLYLL